MQSLLLASSPLLIMSLRVTFREKWSSLTRLLFQAKLGVTAYAIQYWNKLGNTFIKSWSKKVDIFHSFVKSRTFNVSYTPWHLQHYTIQFLHFFKFPTNFPSNSILYKNCCRFLSNIFSLLFFVSFSGRSFSFVLYKFCHRTWSGMFSNTDIGQCQYGDVHQIKGLLVQRSTWPKIYFGFEVGLGFRLDTELGLGLGLVCIRLRKSTGWERGLGLRSGWGLSLKLGFLVKWTFDLLNF